MIKSRLLVIAVVAAMLSLFGATAANAARTYAPQAYTVVVNPNSVQVGDTFTVTFTSTDACSSWTLDEFHGQTAPAGSGKTYVVTLTAPSPAGNYPVTARCTWDPATAIIGPVSHSNTVIPAVFTSKASSDTLLAAPQTDPVTGIARVTSAASSGSGSDNGALPNTGGSHESLLLLGAGLVVVGAGATIVARRRKTSV